MILIRDTQTFSAHNNIPNNICIPPQPPDVLFMFDKKNHSTGKKRHYPVPWSRQTQA